MIRGDDACEQTFCLAVALVALAGACGTSAQQPAFARLPADVLDVLPPSARVRGEPGEMTIQPRACRTVSTVATRRRIVDVAVQEWGFFGFGLADATDVEDDVRLETVGLTPMACHRTCAAGSERDCPLAKRRASLPRLPATGP